MKHILIPTDFSENALKALKYAINIANKTGASLTVLHAYHISQSAGSLMSLDHIIHEDREQDMNTLLHGVNPLLANHISIEGIVRNGTPVDMIVQAAEKLDTDLIMMGSTGAGAMKKMFIGSTASNIIKNTNKAVLTIPANYEGETLKNISLSLDNKALKNNSILSPLFDLIKINEDVKLNLLTIYIEDQENTGIDEDLLMYIEDQKIQFSYSKIIAMSIIEGIRGFIREKNTSLLCLVHHNRGWFENIFHRSVSEDMAHESRIPILVLRG